MQALFPMSNSLDNFIRDALQEHDGVDAAELGTITSSGNGTAGGAGSLPGHAVEGLIARGGMGVVYRARQETLEREVAVKVMTSLADSPEMAARFRREALVLGKLAHPNIVPVYDIGTDDDGQLFYTMKLVKGRTLQAIINSLRDQEPESIKQHSLVSLLTVFRKVCDAMAFAHSQGVLHRDLKPENIMVGEFGEVLVMDWGLAKIQDRERRRQGEGETLTSELSVSPSLQVSPSQTIEGSVMGTPQYMSPEQARGEIDALDERSDIFSLGGILYAILTLRPPVEGKTLNEVLEKVRSGVITPPTFHGSISSRKATGQGDVLDASMVKPLPHVQGGRVPSALASVVMKALRLDKAARYQSVEAMSADIAAYQGGFATSAEQAGALTQLKLLMLRHKAVTASLAAMLVLSALFVLKVMASERQALAQQEATRKSLARSQIALADSAFRNLDLGGMLRALQSCPEDLRDQSWRYLWDKRDSSSSLKPVPGFENPSAILAVPGRRGQFALTSAEGGIVIVDLTSGRIVKQFDSGISGLNKIVFSGDGHVLGAVDRSGKALRLFEVETGAALRSADLKSAKVGAMALNHDGSLFAAVIAQKQTEEMRLVGTRDSRVLWRFKPEVKDIAFHPDGSRIFVCGGGAWRHSAILRTSDGSVTAKFDGYVASRALSLDGKVEAVGTSAGEVFLLDSATGAVMQSGRLHSGAIYKMAWMADGHLLTAGSSGKFDDARWVFRILEPVHLSPVETLFGLSHGEPTPWSLNADSGEVMTRENPPRLWHLPVGRELIKTTHPNAEQGRSGCFLSETILLARSDFVIGRYDLAAATGTMKLLDESPRGFAIVASHPPSQTFAYARRIAGPGAFGFKVFSVRDGQVVQTVEHPLQVPIDDLAFNAAGDRLVAVTGRELTPGPIEVFDARSGASLLTVPGTFRRAVFSNQAGNLVVIDSRSRAAGSVDERLVVLDGRTGAALQTVIHDFQLNALAISPDRKWVAIGGGDARIHLYDAETLREKTSFRVQDSDVTAVAFHPTEPIVATASADLSVKLWEYETARQINYFSGFGGTPISLAFSPGGRLLAVDGQERTSRVFDLAGHSGSGSTTKSDQ